jgi:hypothetical protein
MRRIKIEREYMVAGEVGEPCALQDGRDVYI